MEAKKYLFIDENKLFKAPVIPVREKRTVPIRACKVPFPFEIATTNGFERGEAGDWIIMHPVKGTSVCDEQTFTLKYEEVMVAEKVAPLKWRTRS